jgi:phosphomannomutase
MYALSAFRTYDIRGIWQSEIDEHLGKIMGYALGLHLVEKFATPKILIASDVRENNIPLMENFLMGMKHAGVHEVTAIGKSNDFEKYPYGVCSTPFAYFAAQEFDCTCIFTASHNTSEYVGIKIVDTKALPLASKKLRELFQQHEHTDLSLAQMAPEILTYAAMKIGELKNDLRTKYATLSKIPTITIDYSHGAATHFEQSFFREALWEHAIHIFSTPDGDFPAHETDTSRFANYEPLIKTIQENGSECGFMFDGDADRFWLVLRDGRIITGDIILSIIAKELLTDGTVEKLGSKTIFQEVFCGKIVADTVKKYGGDLRMTRVGRNAFVGEVVEANGLLAGEVSTHLLFKEYGTIEMPLAGFYYLLRAFEKSESIPKLMEEFDIYTRGQVLQFRTDNQDGVIEKLKENYAQYDVITIDGVRVEGPDWWFCVRKSWTEPLIKVALEGKNQAQYDSLLAELRTFFSHEWATEKL